jgi:hypothetical protein
VSVYEKQEPTHCRSYGNFLVGGRTQMPFCALFQTRMDTWVEPPMFHMLAGKLPHMSIQSPCWDSNPKQWGTIRHGRSNILTELNTILYTIIGVNICIFQVPLFVPIFVLLVSIYLVVAPIIQDPRVEFFYAFLFSISGIVFYVPFVVYKKKLPVMGKLT